MEPAYCAPLERNIQALSPSAVSLGVPRETSPSNDGSLSSPFELGDACCTPNSLYTERRQIDVQPPVTGGWFADQDLTTGPNPANGDPQRGRGWSEPASDNSIVGLGAVHYGMRSIGDEHIDSGNPAEPSNDAFEEVGARAAPVQQGDRRLRQVVGDHETGHATACAQVEHVARVTGREVEVFDEQACMPENVLDRPIAEETEAPRLLQDLDEQR